MVFLLLGGASLLVMMGALGMFSRAQVANLKMFGAWIGAIGALALAALLFLTGRGPIAVAALALLGPLVWSWMRDSGAVPRSRAPPGAASGARPAAARGGMDAAEAYAVLGLRPGASRAEILAAHLRLMRRAHPDTGGSDWLASRINQARDVLIST